MKKITSILLLIGIVLSYSCKKDKDEPAKPGKFTLDDKSFDLGLGYYFYSKDPDSDLAAYQITFSNKNVFAFSTDGEIKDVNLVSFVVMVGKDNTFSDGTFELDGSVIGDKTLLEDGVFGHGCMATVGIIEGGENGSIYSEIEKGKVVLKKTGEKHDITFELELESGKKLNGNFTAVLSQSSTPVSR